MKKSETSVHPMIIFWLGLLTGAVLVGLVFSYKSMNPQDLESYLLRYTIPTYDSYRLYDSRSYTDTTSETSIGTPPGGDINPYSIGTPPGDVNPYSIGTPSGG
ncbi:MAG: hypothetical protein O3B47_04020 [bacterium]|nr:hypothetical protein [bacterium]